MMKKKKIRITKKTTRRKKPVSARAQAIAQNPLKKEISYIVLGDMI